MDTIDPRFPPVQNQVSSYSPVILIDKLSKEDKALLWEFLKNNHPQKAKSISNLMKDPFLKLLMDKEDGFSASMTIALKYVPEALKKHQYIF